MDELPRYVFLIRNEPWAAARMLRSGLEGAAHQAAMIERAGGSVIAQYALSGRYDALLILDLPSEEVARAIVLASSARGQYVEDCHAFTPEEIDGARQVVEQLEQQAAQAE